MEINGNSQIEIAKRLSDYIEYDAITTPSAFASKAGIDASGFHKMLKGQLKITATTLKKISVAHGLSMTWLLTGDGEIEETTKAGTVVGTINGDDANVSGGNMTINHPPCTYAVDMVIKEVSALRRLIEKKDEQIDKILGLLDEKDKQIDRLLNIISNLQQK